MAPGATDKAPEAAVEHTGIFRFLRTATRSLKNVYIFMLRVAMTKGPVGLDSLSAETLGSVEDQVEPEKDPWVIAYEQNVYSAIYRLPDELLLKIMAHLPLGSLYLLRQSCRLFMCLFEGPEFADLRWNPHMSTWPFPSLAKAGVSRSHLSSSESLELKAILRRDAVCQRCRLALDSGETKRIQTRLRQPMYCGGCKENHPTILFSILQRQIADTMRICIGLEGYIRLCQHKTISWSDVEKVRNRRQYSYEKRISCLHSSHRQSILQKDRQQIERYGSRSKAFQIYPSTTLRFQLRTSEAVGLFLNWLVVPIAMRAEQPATVRHIQSKMRWAELATTISLCPHESLHDIGFLRAFDPNRCACIRPDLPLTHSLSECPVGRDKTCCLCYARQHGGYKAGRLLATQDCMTTFPWLLDKVVEHHSSCFHCRTRYTWERAGDLVTLTRRSWATVRKPCDIEWVQLLDLESYNLEEPESCQALWCDDPGCATARQWRTRRVLSERSRECGLE